MTVDAEQVANMETIEDAAQSRIRDAGDILFASALDEVYDFEQEDKAGNYAEALGHLESALVLYKAVGLM